MWPLHSHFYTIVALIVLVASLTMYSFYSLGKLVGRRSAFRGIRRELDNGKQNTRNIPVWTTASGRFVTAVDQPKDYPGAQDQGLNLLSQSEYSSKAGGGETTCPLCGCIDVATGTLDAEGSIAVSDCACGNCHFNWWEIWECTGYNCNQPVEQFKDVRPFQAKDTR